MAASLDLSASVDASAVLEVFEAVEPSIRASVRKALLQAGAMVQGAAKGTSRFEDRSGKLRDSIAVRLSESPRSQTVVVKPSDHVALFLEAGVAAYGGSRNARGTVGKRATRNQRADRLTLRQRIVSENGWRIEPRPFMADALEGTRNQIADLLEAALGWGLEDARGR